MADTGPSAEISAASSPMRGVGETSISDPSPSRNTPTRTGKRIAGSGTISPAVTTPGRGGRARQHHRPAPAPERPDPDREADCREPGDLRRGPDPGGEIDESH